MIAHAWLVALLLVPPIVVFATIAFIRHRGRVHQREVATARLATWLSASRSVERAP